MTHKSLVVHTVAVEFSLNQNEADFMLNLFAQLALRGIEGQVTDLLLYGATEGKALIAKNARGESSSGFVGQDRNCLAVPLIFSNSSSAPACARIRRGW